MSELWTPSVVAPDEANPDGGSVFDDEMEDNAPHMRRVAKEAARLIDHINERPDHFVYVASSDDRTKMRSVFNRWFSNGVIDYHPTIKIEYGVADGSIRVAE